MSVLDDILREIEQFFSPFKKARHVKQFDDVWIDAYTLEPLIPVDYDDLPEYLYHGTNSNAVPLICKEGLKRSCDLDELKCQWRETRRNLAYFAISKKKAMPWGKHQKGDESVCRVKSNALKDKKCLFFVDPEKGERSVIPVTIPWGLATPCDVEPKDIECVVGKGDWKKCQI